MKNELKVLTSVSKGIAKLMGPHTEVVLYDLSKEEKTVINIENGYITGRSPGYILDPSLYETIVDLTDEDGLNIGYGSASKFSKELKSSHFIFRDERGTPFAMLCVNQDISNWVALRAEIDSLINTHKLTQEEAVAQEDLQGENYIQKMTRQLILDEIERSKPTPIDSKETKIEIVRSLERKGVFAVKDAVPQVCSLLSISQATLYTYLRTLRLEKTDL